MMSQALLKVTDLKKAYGAIQAVGGVSFEVQPGEIFGVIGPNGSGKTTMFNSVLGQITPNSGSIEFKGHNITGASPLDLSRLGVGRTFQTLQVFGKMSVRDNLLMGAFSRSDGAGVRASLDEVLHRFPRLKDRLSQAAGTMSGGEQQMLVIGRALMAKPKLLLLDEPSLGVAPKIVQDIARSIVAINRDEKVSVLLVEQNSRMALRISHRAYALSTGSIALSGASADLVKDERVQRLYLGGEV